MARVVILGASIGGLPAAYEARAILDKKHAVTVISNVDSFHFVPSNPWVAVGWRQRKDISFALGPVLERKGIKFVHAAAERIEPEQNRVVTTNGEVPYDYLIIATGHVADIGLRRHEIDRDLSAQFFLPQIRIEDECHLVGRAETRGALGGPHHDRSWVLQKTLIGAPRLFGMVHGTHRLGIAAGP